MCQRPVRAVAPAARHGARSRRRGSAEHPRPLHHGQPARPTRPPAPLAASTYATHTHTHTHTRQLAHGRVVRRGRASGVWRAGSTVCEQQSGGSAAAARQQRGHPLSHPRTFNKKKKKKKSWKFFITATQKKIGGKGWWGSWKGEDEAVERHCTVSSLSW